METVKEKERAGKTNVQEMMKVYRELGTPGAQHKLLARTAGKWKTRTRSWADQDMPPVESDGTSEQIMIFDGRYREQRETGEMMGRVFTGIAISGYNNNSGKYFTAWLDSMSTSLSLFEGTASADGMTITLGSSFNDPIRGPMTHRAVTRIIDNNEYAFEMYGIDKNGKEIKMMETIYTREK